MVESARGLVVSGLGKDFGEFRVFDDISFAAAAGEAVVLAGRNGSGKSTLLRCVVGVEPATRGEVRWDGEELDERSPRIRRDLAVVMDDLDFFPDLSVVEHLDLVARAHGSPTGEEEVDRILDEIGLMAQSGQLPGSLSSGQRQRLSLASALVRPRRLLVLDEPEKRLDAQGLAWLSERLGRELADGLTILFATHDPGLLERVATRVVRLDE